MYWPLLNMYSENFGFGPGVFFLLGVLSKSGEGINSCGMVWSSLKVSFNAICRNLTI